MAAKKNKPPLPAPAVPPTPAAAGWLLTAAVSLVVAICIFVRLRYLGVPFERDEGEYAYAGSLILQGIPPYAQAYNMKMPGIYYAYAAIMALFGSTHVAVHAGLLLINVLTGLGVFLLGRWLAGTGAAAVAVAVFALLSTGQAVTGTFANAEHFVLVFALFGIFATLQGLESNSRAKLLAGGVLLGLGFLMKQHGAAFIALAMSLVLVSHGLGHKWLQGIRDGALVAVGAILPFGLLVGAMVAMKVEQKFFFWTFSYAAAYVNVVPLGQALDNFVGGIVPAIAEAWPLWGLASLGTMLAVWRSKDGLRQSFLPLALVFGFLATAPGFYFRNHYFLFPLPLLAIGAGAAYGLGKELLSRWLPGKEAALVALALWLAAMGTSLWQQRQYLFVMSPEQMSRATYGYNPFPESIPVADYIRQNSAPGDRIAVLGSEPQIYFYAQRRAATGYIYMYPLMEPQPYASAMQQQMIREIAATKPAFMVTVGVEVSWLVRNSSDRTVIDWGMRYIAENYEQVGLADLTPWGTRYTWGGAAAGAEPSSSLWIRIYRRRPSP